MKKYLQKFSLVNRIAHWNALISFLLGTLSLLSFVITQEDDLIGIGVYYLTGAFWWNCFVLAAVIIAAIIYKTEVKQTLKTIAALLLNIPIAFIYFLIVVEIAI